LPANSTRVDRSLFPRFIHSIRLALLFFRDSSVQTLDSDILFPSQDFFPLRVLFRWAPPFPFFLVIFPGVGKTCEQGHVDDLPSGFSSQDVLTPLPSSTISLPQCNSSSFFLAASSDRLQNVQPIQADVILDFRVDFPTRSTDALFFDDSLSVFIPSRFPPPLPHAFSRDKFRPRSQSALSGGEPPGYEFPDLSSLLCC